MTDEQKNKLECKESTHYTMLNLKGYWGNINIQRVSKLANSQLHTDNVYTKNAIFWHFPAMLNKIMYITNIKEDSEVCTPNMNIKEDSAVCMPNMNTIV